MTSESIKIKIQEARNKGVPDEITFKYLNDKGLIPQDRIVNQPKLKLSDLKGDFSVVQPSDQPRLSTETSFGGVSQLPGVKQVIDFGVGVGSNIGKAGIGLGQTFLKGANVISNVIGQNEKNPYDKAIAGLEATKENLYNKPFENQLNTVSGKAGEIAGDIAQFTTPGSAIIKGQELLTGAYRATDIAAKLASGGVPSKVANYIAEKGIQALTEAVGTGSTIFGTTGGDKTKAVETGVGAGVLSSLTHVGADIVKKIIPQTVKENVARVFGLTGKKSLTDISTDGGTEKATGALQTISNLAPQIKVTDIDGIEKAFDPTKATFLELPQALNKSKDLVYNAYTDLAKRAGEQGGEFTARDFYKVIDDLDKYNGKGYTPAFSSKAGQIKEAIQRFVTTGENNTQYFKNTAPEEIQGLIESINKDVNPLSDRAGAEVAQGASQKLREIMDNKITAVTGDTRYQQLRNAYSQLKSVEKDVINKWKMAMRKSGIKPGLIDGIATIDGLMGIIRLSPENLARAGLTKLVQKTFTYLRDPEVNLRRAFKLIQKGADVPSSTRFGVTNIESAAAQKGTAAVKDLKSLPNTQGGFVKLPDFGVERDSIVQKLKSLDSSSFAGKKGMVNFDAFGEVEDILKKIESGKDTAEDLARARELIRLTAKK